MSYIYIFPNSNAYMEHPDRRKPQRRRKLNHSKIYSKGPWKYVKMLARKYNRKALNNGDK